MYATRTVAQTVWLLISVGLWSAHTPVRAGVVRGIQEMQVPRIVNHIMPVEATKVERESYASIRSRCKEQHPGWKFKMWTLQSGEHLLQQRYAWFLDTYHGFKLNISKYDALRPAILHAVGGVYLDNDVDCLNSMDTSVAGSGLILQAETKQGDMLTNAVMASRPAHPFWLELLKLMAQRQTLVRDRHLRDGDLILNSTGPYALSSLLRSMIQPGSVYLPGEHSPQGATARVFPVGAWFQPCQCRDVQCHHDLMVAAIEGRIKPYIVGHHHCTATWWTAHKARNRRRVRVLVCLGGAAVLGAASLALLLHSMRGSLGGAAAWQRMSRPLLRV